MQHQRRLYVVEDARRRVVTAARDAGHARAVAAAMIHGRPDAPERDALVVREPEEEEAAEFEARQPGPDSEVNLGAIRL